MSATVIPLEGHPGVHLSWTSPKCYEVIHDGEVLGAVEHHDWQRSEFSVVFGWAAVVNGERINSVPLTLGQAAARVLQAAALSR